MSLIKIDIEKYRNFAHEMRRQARNAELSPYDEIISKRIPGGIHEVDAELKRQLIREKYYKIQDAIDAANKPEEIKNIISKIEIIL